MESRKIYKVELTKDEIREIIYALELSQKINRNDLFIGLIKDLDIVIGTQNQERQNG